MRGSSEEGLVGRTWATEEGEVVTVGGNGAEDVPSGADANSGGSERGLRERDDQTNSLRCGCHVLDSEMDLRR